MMTEASVPAERGTGSELVWHYTSLSALDKILTSNSFLATEVNFLNDIRETEIADEIFEDVLEKFSADEDRREFARQVQHYIASMAELKGYPRYNAVIDEARFVFCASSEPDDMFAWRTYGSKDEIGCAIGIDPSRCLGIITEGLTQASQVSTWESVVYDPADLSRQTDERFERLYQEYLDEYDPDPDRNGQMRPVIFSDDVRQYLRTRAKDQSFYQEREMRIMVSGIRNDMVRMLQGSMGPRPHIALGTIDSEDSVGTPRSSGRSRLPIREIKLGPDAPQIAPLSVSWLLLAKGYATQPEEIFEGEDEFGMPLSTWDSSEIVRISRSQLPFRSM